MVARKPKRLKHLNRVGAFASGNPRYYLRVPGRQQVAMPDVAFRSDAFLDAYDFAMRFGRQAPPPDILALLYRALRTSRNRAYAKGRAHDLDIEGLVFTATSQRFRCAVSGVPFTAEKTGRGRMPFAPSIDRIDPDGGYTTGNIRLVCLIVNVAIADFGDDAFKRICHLARYKRTNRVPNNPTFSQNGKKRALINT